MEATLEMIRTSEQCLSYRLRVPQRTTPIWTTRAFADDRQSQADARARVVAWAQKHGVRVLDAHGQVAFDSPPESGRTIEAVEERF
jgi:hypothetical protein